MLRKRIKLHCTTNTNCDATLKSHPYRMQHSNSHNNVEYRIKKPEDLSCTRPKIRFGLDAFANSVAQCALHSTTSLGGRNRFYIHYIYLQHNPTCMLVLKD